ncbi:MAG: DUF2164 domain-containing protein [Janthinobacterium lividum]
MAAQKPLELTDHARKEAIASLQRYFQQNLPDEIGDLPAGLLLDFFLEEIGPTIYNKAVVDAQQRMQVRLNDVDGELYVDPFQYWSRIEQRRKKSRG